jgi:S1-C subfamily serine protease
MIMSVESGGPAAAANLLQGDVLVALDGQSIAQMDDLQGLLAGRAGQSATATVVRAGALHEIGLTIGEK